MPNLNRVMLMGNLTRDPELRYTPSNMAVAQIGLAINRKWKNQQGEQQEETTFVDCEAWGRTAEVINQYLKKGRPIFIEGRLKLDQWQDKEGHNRSKIKVVVETFQFVDSRGGGEGGGGEDGGGSSAPRSAPRSNRPSSGGGTGTSGSGGGGVPSPQAGGEPHQPVEEEDIPF